MINFSFDLNPVHKMAIESSGFTEVRRRRQGGGCAETIVDEDLGRGLNMTGDQKVAGRLATGKKKNDFPISKNEKSGKLPAVK